MKTELIRHNAGKPDYTLIDYKSLEPMVRVLEFGAGKYERNNWRLGGPNSEKLKILESLQRHIGELIDAVNMGTPEIDHESHEHLIGHILCNSMFYSFYHVIGKEHTNERQTK